MSVDILPEAPIADPRPKPQSGAKPPLPQPGSANKGRRWKRALLVIAVVGVLATAGAALLRTSSPARDAQVLTHSVTRGSLVVSVTEEGTMESSSNTEIKCKVKGTSTVLWVVESGTEVEPGDLLIRLDTSTIEDNISAQKIIYENALANKTTSESDVAVAEISITEYLEGTFQSELATKEKELVIAESGLKSAKNALTHAERMFRRGYISQLELDTKRDAVAHAGLEVRVKQTDLKVLQEFTKAKTLKELESVLEVAKARFASDSAALELEQARLTREEQQLENCVIRAEVGGMVIYPSAAAWKEQPDIEEGATVREDQVLLIIPDLKAMQVKIGIHESKVDRVKPGMEARIELKDSFIGGRVESVASVTKPTGWWNGNVVKYDTVIEIGEQPGLKPGMSVAVEVFLARYEDVLTIPVAAVVEHGQEFFCWVDTDAGITQRTLKLGDSNDQFIIVEDGLEQSEQVVLNPIDFVDEAQLNALKPVEEHADENLSAAEARGSDSQVQANAPVTGEQKAHEPVAADILRKGDNNDDAVLTKDEFDEKSRPFFDSTDTDGDGDLDAVEIEVGLKRMRETTTAGQ